MILETPEKVASLVSIKHAGIDESPYSGAAIHV